MRVLLALSTALLSACAGPERVIGLRQVIHHDDFDYSVQSVQTMDQIDGRRAAGTFDVVTFQVDNHARAVRHEWGNDIAYVVDQDGHAYENDGRTQAAFARVERFDHKDRYVTAAGATERTQLVFDLPASATDPYLKVRGWPLMGDLFDGFQFRRVRIPLLEPRLPP